MNAIQDALRDLHHRSGIKGAVVVTLDGLVAAESLDDRYPGDVVGGLASFLLMTLNRSLKEGGLGGCDQFLLHATHGKVILKALDDAYLVCLFDQFADVATVRQEVREVAQRIRMSSRIGADG
ncbi:MAG: roadblock/LC7 domain-containing protein [bacterium]|nr:roadblock/LC7 domain-containing protein [bacterium]